MTDILTGTQFASMVSSGAAAIENHKNEINELNVFPVPDGDTGTNMSLTMSNGAAECAKADKKDLFSVADAVAGGLLRGARGNSGVILSLLFRGISKSLKDKSTASASEFAAAMAAGVDAAYKAVMKPAEGTILTVSRLASAAAVEASAKSSDLEEVLLAAVKSGKEALADTVNINPVLKKAGVVDSGGKGYIYILDAMLKALQGMEIRKDENGETRESADFNDFRTEDITFAYCTEFIVSRENDRSVPLLRSFLSERGDSLVLVDDEKIIKVHVHTNEPGVVLTEALKYGTLLTVKIENMRQQHSAKVIDAAPAESDVQPVQNKPYGMVAVCAGEGMEEIFRNIGVDSIVTGGQTMNPSTADILGQIDAIPADTVFVFPNNKNIIMAAQQAVPMTEKNVVVIPTGTVPQGISAVLAFDESASPEENGKLMIEAASGVHTAQITYAARDSEFDGHSIKAGEYLALLDGTLISNEAELVKVVEEVFNKLEMLSPDLLTVYYGADVEETAAKQTAAMAEKLLPDSEVNVLYGGQPVYYYIISAE